MNRHPQPKSWSAPPRSPRILTILLLFALATAGCAKPTAPNLPDSPPPQAQVPTPQPPTPQAPPPGSPEAEIARWTDIVSQSPTADNWNELSYANIQAGRWEAAAKAGEEALKLKYDHPFALYNTGLALLNSDKPMEAIHYLKQSAGLQPDRYEPQLRLAQAYDELGHYLLASHYAGQAVRLAKDDPEALKTQQMVADMPKGKPPADLATSCAEQLTHEGFFLCLYEEASAEHYVSSGASAYPGKRYTLWYGPEGGTTKAIPIGYTEPGEFEPVTLPGGVQGYWLSGGWVGAGVAQTIEYRLFVREGGELRQILFLGGDYFEGGSFSDFMRSPYTPRVKGDQIFTDHRDDVSGSRTMQTTRQLSLVGGTATVVTEAEVITGPLTQLEPEIEVESGWGYQWAYMLAEDASILVDEQPAERADLRLGMYTTIFVNGGKITFLEARSAP